MSAAATYIVSIAVPVIGGMISGALTRKSIESWYVTLKKPSWNPPRYAFPIAWTTLYAMMGTACGIVWQNGALESNSAALAVYFVQLIVNLTWSHVFFNMHMLGGALAHMTVLWALIIATIALFWKVSSVAGGLLIPYLLWVTFAWFLNYTIWTLNSGRPGKVSKH